MREDFLRRYATSPIHVPRLERLLDAYGAGGTEDAFISAYLAWDRACPDAEAARVVAEVLSAFVDATGSIVRLSDQAVQGALRVMADPGPHGVHDRARVLRALTSQTDAGAIRGVSRLLEDVGRGSGDRVTAFLESRLRSLAATGQPPGARTPT